MPPTAPCIVSLGPSYGEWLPYDQHPAVMRDATVAVEDRRFRSHLGVDPIGIARSVKVALRIAAAGLQGGSTITQQLARNDLPRTTRRSSAASSANGSWRWRWSASSPRTRSSNSTSTRSITAAAPTASTPPARKFFGHGANTLSLAEAAVIAGLVKAPSQLFADRRCRGRGRPRRRRARSVMQRNRRDHRGARPPAPIPRRSSSRPSRKQNSVRYFTDWALPQLELLIDETDAPLEVWTTLDLGMQRAADAAIRANAPAGAQGALVALDRDGAVRAMVGGKDYVVVDLQPRDAGDAPAGIVVQAVRLSRRAGGRAQARGHDRRRAGDDRRLEPAQRFAAQFAAQVTLRTAFAYSLNTVAAKLGQEVGFATVADMARRFGITTPVNTHPVDGARHVATCG